jgi:fumarate reductase flavoprotein subunit
MIMTLPAELTADLVIVGAGGAGLTAAAAALEMGLADILVAEKGSSVGGNTAQSAGMFAVDSPAQKRKGIAVSREETFREKMAYANWRVDPDLVRECIDLSGEMVDWLEGKGLRFDNVIEFLREDKAPKVFHSFCLGSTGFIGRPVVAALEKECLQRGVRFTFNRPVSKLLRDSAGNVAGVTAVSEGREYRINSRGVILASGGFGGNGSLLERYFPGHGGVFTLNRPEMTGDGLFMAEEAGATIDDNVVLLVTGPHHYPWSHELTLLVRRPEILLVNKNGERYCDETIFLDYHTEAGNALSRQPDMICYGLVDSGMRDRMVGSGEIVSGMEREAGGSGAWLGSLESELEAGVARGTVFKANAWEEIAHLMGAQPAVLAATVARYNSHCESGHDGEFFKEKGFLQPLRRPPYFAILGRQGFDTTLGGIKVTHRMEVLDKHALPIPGMYAAGDCASGWEHQNYNLRHPGSAMTFALCSGYIAGKEAARFVQRETAK